MIDGQVSFKNYCCYMYTTVLLTILEIHQQIRLLYCWLCELDFGYHSRLLKMSTVVQKFVYNTFCMSSLLTVL